MRYLGYLLAHKIPVQFDCMGILCARQYLASKFRRSVNPSFVIALFVRYGEVTVIPFPFKHLRLYAETLSVDEG